MKAIYLGKEVNGVKIVEGIQHDVNDDFEIKQPIITDLEIPEIEQKFGKQAYLGYKEDTNEFVVIYVDRDLTKDEQIELLHNKVTEQDAVIEELLFSIIPDLM